MTILTDAIVDKSARELAPEWWSDRLQGPENEPHRQEARRLARACLAAALPDILEGCAIVIEDMPSRLFAITHPGDDDLPGRALNAGTVKRELADLIRALSR